MQYEDHQLIEKSSITDESKGYIREISKWLKFFAILGYISLGFMFLVGFGLLLAGSALPIFFNSPSYFPIIAGLAYMVLPAIYFIPIRYMYKAAVDLRNGIDNNDDFQLTNGFSNLKSHYKFIGIFVIIFLGLYALIIVGSIIGAIMGLMR